MCFGRSKWTDFYPDEDALVAAMLRVNYPV